MKYFLHLMLFVLLTATLKPQSNITIGAGTSIKVDSATKICADTRTITGILTGKGIWCSDNRLKPFKLNIHAYIEGLYDQTTTNMIPDTITVFISDQRNSFASPEYKTAVLNSNGWATVYFNMIDYNDYYFFIRHRNALETWSYQPKFFDGDSLQIDFAVDSSQAFGGNMKKIGSNWCIYSGDADHSGMIDLGDLILIDTDNQNFVSGYTASDINGDGQITLDDLIIADVNNQNFISVMKPAGAYKLQAYHNNK